MVSRPHDQAVSLCTSIEAQGGVAILAPMIAIRPISDQKRCGAMIDRLDEYTIVVFISRNAVECGVEKVRQCKKDLNRTTIYW